MILRRIIEHVRTQNWTAVFLDFAIVVVGVFMGIQLGNWNAARADERRARDYLERIRGDLLGDTSSLSVRKTFNETVISYGDRALAFAEANEQDRRPDWPTVLAFFQASQLFPFSSNNATFDELRSAGELGLIENQELRTALAQYYVTGSGAQADYILKYIPEYRETIRGLTPSTVTKYIWDQCHEEVGYEVQKLIECPEPDPGGREQLILDGYLAHPTMLAELRFWMSTLDTVQALLGINENTARELAAEIDRELE
ncbi:MAG: hypothetical protein AAF668_05830 [Pseudomonadota bacterium]